MFSFAIRVFGPWHIYVYHKEKLVLEHWIIYRGTPNDLPRQHWCRLRSEKNPFYTQMSALPLWFLFVALSMGSTPGGDWLFVNVRWSEVLLWITLTGALTAQITGRLNVLKR